jgi:hypothetical protein
MRFDDVDYFFRRKNWAAAGEVVFVTMYWPFAIATGSVESTQFGGLRETEDCKVKPV